MYYVLFYKFVTNYLEARASFRADHLRLAQDAKSRGELILAGALEDPKDEGMLIFKVADETTVKLFAEQDTYVINGIVKHWQICQWNVAID